MLQVVDYEDRSARLRPILNRRATFDEEVDRTVSEILEAVRRDGDSAVRRYSEKFDGVSSPVLSVDDETGDRALSALDDGIRSVLQEAATNIRRFHEHQRQKSWYVEEVDGVVLGQRILPLERVGLYVPGSTAFYPSSLLMNAIPAQVAGVDEIHVVSPPGADGLPHPLVLATASLLGIRRIHAVGGAQAVAALAYGTENIPGVDKIVGPGNVYVTAAKRQVYGRVDIGAITGPSEVVVLADGSADADFIGSDLLSQAEHDARASSILVTPSRTLAEKVSRVASALAANVSRREIVERSLRDYGACVVTPSLDEAIDLVNELAPEHLEVMVSDPWGVLSRIRNAGAVFLGGYSSEPVGDYFAGPNHVLPTGGTARYASPLGVYDFLKRQSIIAYTRERMRQDGPKIVRFAEAEGLTAHALAIQTRLDRIAREDV